MPTPSELGRLDWCAKHYARWKVLGAATGLRAVAGEVQRYLEEVVLPYRGTECLIWPYAADRNGRAHIRIDGRLVQVGRLACVAMNGEPPEAKPQAAHNCGNGHLGCVAPTHLRWDSHTGNQRDRVEHGTSNRGERSGLVKLTADQVRQIRAMAGTKPQPQIAKTFGIAAPTVSSIVNRRSWAWLE